MSRSSIRVLRRHLEVAEIPGHRPCCAASTGRRRPPCAVRDRGVQDLLHPVHVGGEAGDDQPLPALAEHPVQGGGDVALRRGEAGHLGVGGVDHEQVDPLLPESGEGPQVGDPAVQRQLVHLEVAGVQDRAGRRRIATASASGMEWLTATNSSPNAPDAQPLPVGDHLASVLRIRCSRIFSPEQGQGQFRSDQRDVGALPQQVGHRADVVLVAVGEHQAHDVVQPVGDGVEARQDQVDARMVSSGNSTPQSTAGSGRRYSKAVMLRPTSPSPPSGIIRRVRRDSGGGVFNALAATAFTVLRWPSGVRRRPADPGRSEVRECLLGGSGNHGLRKYLHPNPSAPPIHRAVISVTRCIQVGEPARSRPLS